MADNELMGLIVDEMRELRKEVKELRESFHEFQLQVVSDEGVKRGVSATMTAIVSAGVSAIIAFVAAYIRNH